MESPCTGPEDAGLTAVGAGLGGTGPVACWAPASVLGPDGPLPAASDAWSLLRALLRSWDTVGAGPLLLGAEAGGWGCADEGGAACDASASLDACVWSGLGAGCEPCVLLSCAGFSAGCELAAAAAASCSLPSSALLASAMVVSPSPADCPCCSLCSSPAAAVCSSALPASGLGAGGAGFHALFPAALNCWCWAASSSMRAWCCTL
mmetsp:Transcript_9675/g.24011  ORF Transcript_9675/g.24011 Transcript_9675/m.24011 type:complete len:206 (+) Transcript_9675:465-1082(+)